jgi:hypothetical protein
MNTLVFAGLYLTLFPSVNASSLCPNLSGKFMIQGEDGQVHISIVQQGCERITIIRENSYLGDVTTERHILTIDGKAQPDSAWFGGLKQSKTSAKFVGSKLQLEVQTPGDLTVTMVYSLSSANNLVEEERKQGHSKGASMVAIRQR